MLKTSEWVKRQRLVKNLSQEELAKKAGLPKNKIIAFESECSQGRLWKTREEIIRDYKKILVGLGFPKEDIQTYREELV